MDCQGGDAYIVNNYKLPAVRPESESVMRFPPSFLDEIRDRVPISTLIGTRVSFDRKKSNPPKGDFWACCPFHGEKTPSFHCEDRKGRYHCFGCGVTGDHFKFLTDLEGLSFPEAVERVADMAGVPMPARDPEMEKREAQRATLYDVMELAAQFFESQLQSATGAKARAYLRDRGLSTATQQAFRMGYAPESRNALKEFLAGKGVSREQIEACGLVVHGEGIAVSYDRFRDRVMFPIEDLRGRIIAFGGRALSADAPAKYLNSPETELFHKGRVLYNGLRARKACQPQGGEPAKPIIAVEGYMDVIALAQAGIHHVVAPLGTALTEEQLELLWRISPSRSSVLTVTALAFVRPIVLPILACLSCNPASRCALRFCRKGRTRACQPQGGEPAKPIIAVEGYMDVIALAQAGIHHVVAPLGTALTEEQLELLWRISPSRSSVLTVTALAFVRPIVLPILACLSCNPASRCALRFCRKGRTRAFAKTAGNAVLRPQDRALTGP
ncbi:DNA primase [Brucella ceti TE28753-12]|nr:DNA primase [Brucella ceti TE28753-12]